MKLFKSLAIFAIALVINLAPIAANAAGLVPCGGTGEAPCQACHVTQLINRVVAWLVVTLSIVATLLIVAAGFKLVTQGGNSGAVKQAKDTFVNIFIGFLLLLGGWLLVDTLLKALVKDQVYGMWNEIQCVTQPTVTASATGVTPAAGSGTGTGTSTGGAAGSGGTPTQFSTGACSPEALAATWGDAAPTMSCIIRGESGCNPGRLSGSDTLGRVPLNQGGTSFSVGLYQVNLTVHDLNQPACTQLNGGQSLNCSQAFTGRNYSATLVNRDLYTRCVSAAQNVECNTAVARSLLQTRQGYNHWGAYQEPRNNCR